MVYRLDVRTTAPYERYAMAIIAHSEDQALDIMNEHHPNWSVCTIKPVGEADIYIGVAANELLEQYEV